MSIVQQPAAGNDARNDDNQDKGLSVNAQQTGLLRKPLSFPSFIISNQLENQFSKLMAVCNGGAILHNSKDHLLQD